MPAVGLVAFAQECNFLLKWLLWEAHGKGPRFHFFSDYFSCCERLAAQWMGTTELAAEKEASASM